MRRLSEKEADVLMNAAQAGELDMNSMPGYDGGLPPLVYAECTRRGDGTLSWEARHLPIPSRSTWESYCVAETRPGRLALTRSERNEIVKGFVKGEIDDEALPRIYPLRRKPILASVLYIGFGEDARPGSMPKMPADWCKQFNGFIRGVPESAQCYEFIDGPELHERGEYQRELMPIDWSTGEPIEPSMVYYYDSLCISIQLFIETNAEMMAREGWWH